jgi:two-component system, chemotaxis family, CheB/CheR fusion protein
VAGGDELRQLVVIGASSGGIEALSALLGSLPAGLPAAVVIAQHLSPTHTSHLEGILARRTAMPVRTVADRMPLQPGIVYVVPPNRHVEVTDHELHLTPDRGGPHPSIDLLLSSAAQAFGENLIAVVLTGQGADGASGARAVKAAGGVVLIQDPATAAYPSMPRALAPTTVDVAAPVEQLGALVQALLRESEPAGPLQAGGGLQAFLAHVRERQGLDFTSYRTPTILRRLHRRLVATGTASLDAYRAYLETHPEEYQRLVQAFLIQVTEFFRDQELYDYLRDHVLPEIIARARREGRGVRCWSAGCATGEEAYSLAIVLTELLGDALEQTGVRIFATDLDGEAVAFARRGVYPAAALRGLPADLVARHFSLRDDAYVVNKRVRSLIVFGQQDLGQRAPFPQIDLVLCRNVLIYFAADLQRRALQLFTFALRDGGYLALGKAESARPLAEYFEAVDARIKVYRRRGGRILFPPSQVRRVRSADPAPRRPTGGGPPDLRLPGPADRRATGTAEDVVGALTVGVVVVDRHYDIQAINPAARRLFGVHGPALGEDFLHLVQAVSPSVLRPPIDAALRGESPPALEDVAAMDTVGGEARYLQVVCLPNGGRPGDPRQVVLQAVDVTRTLEQRGAAEAALEGSARAREQGEAAAREREAALQAAVADMEGRLRQIATASRHLQETNDALVVANTELRALTEEYQISNEEAQAAAEEVETLNEELQASNEELETLNEELQSAVEELHATNEDLEARSEELQELATRAEEERTRLEAILAGLSDAVLVVGASGETVLANAAYERLFGDPGAPPPAEDAEGRRLAPEELPAARAARGETFAAEFAVADAEGGRRWFEAYGQPITNDGRRQGVAVIRDVTDRSLRRLQEEFLSLASHELVTPLTVIRGSLQMLLRALERDPAKARQYARTAIDQVDQLVTIARDLVDVARLQRGQLRVELRPVDLRAITMQATDVAQTLAGRQQVRVRAAEAPVMVRGDAGRLQQVLLNLVTNAIRYAPDSPIIDVRLLVREGNAEVQVQDYGPGIPADEVAAVFARFVQGTQANRGGLGLGLYIAQQIVAAHGGTIRVDSAIGEGTAFTVSLPLLGATEATPPGAPASQEVGRAEPRPA